MPELPAAIEPMQAKLHPEPFASDEHLFEIKWDGIRALAFTAGTSTRLVSRRQQPLLERYPEFGGLVMLPPGLVLDGEIVMLREGKPDFSLLMAREHARNPLRIRNLARTQPCAYVLFDLLYQDHEPLLEHPLVERRARLEEVFAHHRGDRWVLSDGITGDGITFYEEACRQQLEGVVAKRLLSRYLPGRRTDAWRKVKRRQRITCVVLGAQCEAGEVRSLIIAAPDATGALRCVGKVGSGLDARLRAQLEPRLAAHARPGPLIACKHRGDWVEPLIYCVVEYLERTPHGELRAPVFKELLPES